MATGTPHPVLIELRTERKRRGLTQAEIADATDTALSAISAIETGTKWPRLRTLTRYAAALGYDITLTRKAGT